MLRISVNFFKTLYIEILIRELNRETVVMKDDKDFSKAFGGLVEYAGKEEVP